MTVPHSLDEGKKITYISLPLSLFKKKSIGQVMHLNVNIFIELR